jgi:hypothetical protein
MSGRQEREWIRRGRQRRLQIGRRRFGQVQDLGHQRWCPSFKKFLFCSWSRDCGPRSWGHVAPKFHHCCHGVGEQHAFTKLCASTMMSVPTQRGRLGGVCTCPSPGVGSSWDGAVRIHSHSYSHWRAFPDRSKYL